MSEPSYNQERCSACGRRRSGKFKFDPCIDCWAKAPHIPSRKHGPKERICAPRDAGPGWDNPDTVAVGKPRPRPLPAGRWRALVNDGLELSPAPAEHAPMTARRMVWHRRRDQDAELVNDMSWVAKKLYLNTGSYVEAPLGLDAKAYAAWSVEATDRLLTRNLALSNDIRRVDLQQDAYEWLTLIKPNPEHFYVLPDEYEKRVKPIVRLHIEECSKAYKRWERELGRGKDVRDLALWKTADKSEREHLTRQQYTAYRPDTEDPQQQLTGEPGQVIRGRARPPGSNRRPASEWEVYERALEWDSYTDRDSAGKLVPKRRPKPGRNNRCQGSKESIAYNHDGDTVARRRAKLKSPWTMPTHKTCDVVPCRVCEAEPVTTRRDLPASVSKTAGHCGDTCAICGPLFTLAPQAGPQCARDGCERYLPSNAPERARFCSNACRQASYRNRSRSAA
jgi:hypothetical protein